MKIFHLVDHIPPGSIFYLVKPLSTFEDQFVFTSFDSEYKITQNDISIINNNINSAVVLHCTGRHLPFFSDIEKFIKTSSRSFVFMHVSPAYLRLRSREKTLEILHHLFRKYGTSVLTTGSEIANLYLKEGLAARNVQVGIPSLNRRDISNQNSQKYIVTTCTDKSTEYRHIKGIDLFEQLMKKHGLRDKALIAGSAIKSPQKIRSVALSHAQLIETLANSLAYIQLSRTEAYNLTAIEAKRLGIPVIVSDTEGHKDNIRFGYRVRNLEEASEKLELILNSHKNAALHEVIDNNLRDSLQRETPEIFANSIRTATEW